MPNQLTLTNTSNKVIITVTNADNLMSIYLNPDSGNKGFVKVFEAHQMYMGGVGFGATLDLTNYLHEFKLLNPEAKTIELAVCMSNFAGSGAYHYALSGSLPTHTESGSIAAWNSKMDSYLVRIYP